MQNQMWLRDFLPPDMERLGHKVRILTYGYDCSLQDSDSSAGICDFAKSLLVEINGARTSKKVQVFFPPIIVCRVGAGSVRGGEYTHIEPASVHCREKDVSHQGQDRQGTLE